MFAKKLISRVYSVLFIFVFMLALTFGALDVTPAHAASVRYATPSGIGDCSSWVNACTLQIVLTGAVSGDEIWVMAGTYTPGVARTATFQLKNGVALYGGFIGTETARTQRNPAANVTILSGEIGAASNSDNSYHVVTGATGANLDGFTITAGNANGTYPNDSGGGIYNNSNSPTLTNVTFSGNSAQYGGGMHNEYGSPALTNITFSGNSVQYGGGMHNYSSSPALTNVTFSGNSAQYGGGMFGDFHSSPMLTNITFSGNSASLGGGMCNFPSSSPMIRNTIFWGNTGAQIYNDSSTPILSDSVVQGGCPAGSNCTTTPITADPLLGTLGNYGGSTQTIPLLPGSSAIDATSRNCPATDQRGQLRSNPTCDIGAFEGVDSPPVITSNGGGATASVSVAENSTAVTTVTATDADAGATQTYSISGGADQTKFTINAASGALAFVSAPNFESPTDAGGNNIYDVTVQVSDGSLTDSQDMAVTVTNVNEAPVITEGTSTDVSMSEDGSPTPFSLTLHATDVDGGDTTFTWSISTPASHGTASSFGTGTSKSIVYSPALNYNGSDSFVVQVSDGFGGTDTITVNVTITAVEPTPFTIFLPLILR